MANINQIKDTLRDKCDSSSDCLRNCCISSIIAPLYFVVFVLMAQFVLVNVVVAVLMKHLEESHKQMDEDEDFEIDREIAREIQAERQALFEAIERRNREKGLKIRRPLMKMASLPSNFTFSFHTATPLNEQRTIQQNDYLDRLANVQNDEPCSLIDMNDLCQHYQNKSEYNKMDNIHNHHNRAKASNLQCSEYVKQNRAQFNTITTDSILNLRPNITGDSISLDGGRESGTNLINNDNIAPLVAAEGTNLHMQTLTTGTAVNGATNRKINGILKKSHSLKLTRKNKFSEMNRKNDYLNNDLFNDNGEKVFLMKMPNSDPTKHEQQQNIRHGKYLNNNCIKSSYHRELPLIISTNVPTMSDSSTLIQSPVTIKINDYHTNEIQQPAAMAADNGPAHQLHLNELLTTTVTTTTASPSRILANNNNDRHRKLSDFLDEESGPLTPSLFGAYPEFNNSDAITFVEDFNEVIDEEEPNENMSLASIESWPSADQSDPLNNE